jgi:GntR family transcriptional regulator
MEPGTLIPSVRELAQRLLVNPNTVARAYQELERRGVVVARRGKGMEVTAEAGRLCRAERQALVKGRVRAALHEAVAAGLEPDEVQRIVEAELKRVNGRP